MKRRFLSVLLALVLVVSFSLVMAVPAAAQTTHTVIPFTVNDDSVSAATWDTTQQHSGLSSVKLVNADVTDANLYAEVYFGVHIAIEDIVLATTSFEAYSTAGDYIPYFIFEIPGTYANDGVLARISNDAAPSTAYTTDWAEFDASTVTGSNWQVDIVDTNYDSVGSFPIWQTWAELQTTYDGEIVNCVVVELSALTTSTSVAHTAYVDDVTISGTTYDLEGTAADYTTIQAAIDAAAATGDTITVVAGTYNTGSGESFPITLGKSLTLSGPNAALSPNTDTRLTEAIIDGQISVGGADNVTIQGFHFMVTPGTASINCPGGFDGDNLSILNNSFTADPATSVSEHEAIGVHSNTAIAGLVIDDNLVTGVRGIWTNPQVVGSDVTITNNVIDGDSTTPAWAGISVDGVSGNISGNTISYTRDAGINVGSVVGPCDDLTISNNTVTYAGRALWGNAGAINLYSDCTDITITGNTLANSYDGITIKAAGGALGDNITIEYNNITGNSNEGIFSAVVGTLDAENNWWGNASGPVPATLPAVGYNSYGDPVDDADTVDYEPWLLAVVETGTTPTTYDKTLALKDDFTLVSTDKEVTTGSAWTATVGYKYTAGSGYTQVTAIELTPVDAYYLKTSGGGGVGINYSTSSPGVVTKTLSAGWNVISCAAETDAATLLSQLRYVQIGEQEGVGVTNLIGQATYGQYTATSLSEPLATTGDWTAMGTVALNAYDGYWVYMNAAKSFGVIPD